MSGRPIITEFFRVPKVWPLLADRLRSFDRPVTVWSGACGTGEEVFSVVIMLAECGIDGEVIGTDIDRPNLHKARIARYERAALEVDVREGRLTMDLLHRHFAPVTGTRLMQVRPELRARVRFDVLCLGEDPPPECDSALLRNVWRHLAPDAQERLAEALSGVLAPSGRLLLGGADLVVPDGRGGLRDVRPRGLSERFVEAAEHSLIWRHRLNT